MSIPWFSIRKNIYSNVVRNITTELEAPDSVGVFDFQRTLFVYSVIHEWQIK